MVGRRRRKHSRKSSVHSPSGPLPSIHFGTITFVPADAVDSPHKFRLSDLGDTLVNWRTVFLNGLFLIGLFILVPLTISEMSRDEVILEPIKIPKTLEDVGYSGEVTTDRLW